MKVSVLLICGVLSAFAQVATTVPVSTPLTTELAAYLQLGLDQVQQIQQIYSDYSNFAAAKNQRIAQVQSEIVTETGRSPLDPMALGLRYAEIESIRRDLRSQLNASDKQMRDLLTDPQKARIKTLSDAAALQRLIYEAAAVNVIAPIAGATTVVRSTETGAVVSFVYVPVSNRLSTYLQLTADQPAKINQINTDLLKASQPRDQRIAEVQSEIVDETGKSPLDPMGLGVRYAEIETLRRQEQSDVETARANIRALLTNAQKAKAATLEDAAKLQPLVGQAECAGLLDSVPGAVIPIIRGLPSGITAGVLSSCSATFVSSVAPAP